MPNSSNFEFLADYDPVFLQLATAAERAFSSDPNTTLIKLRQLGEALAQDFTARTGIVFDAKQLAEQSAIWLVNHLAVNYPPQILFYTFKVMLR
jgi:type I restriction enzyme R subunit